MNKTNHHGDIMDEALSMLRCVYLILLSSDKTNVDDNALMAMSETMGMALEKLEPVRNRLQGVDWMEDGA